MKKSYSFLFACLTFIMVFLVTYNVYFFGDDYYYVTFSQGTLKEFWAHHIQHYMLDNGRAIVHLLVSIFLSIDIIWWKLFNAFMLSSIVYFGSKIATKNTFYSGLIFFLGMCSIGIDVSRQSIYWLTGSFNYVYPIFFLLLYWYVLLKYQDTKKYTLGMCILSFISSATVEQGAMMTFGLNILFLLKNYITNKKINKNYLYLSIFSFFGAISVIFSPATFMRFNLENQDNISLIVKLKELLVFLVNQYLFKNWMLPFNFTFILFGIEKYKNPKIRSFLYLSIPLLIYISYSSLWLSKFSVYKIIVGIILLLILATITFKNISDECKKIKKCNMTFTIATILFIGSQIMLVASNVYGFRNLLFGIFMYTLMIVTEIPKLELSKNKKYLITALASFLGIVIIFHQGIIISGYYESRKIENENINKIHSNTSTKLTLKKPNLNYTWSMPYVSEYHKYYYKKYYHLENIEINWE